MMLLVLYSLANNYLTGSRADDMTGITALTNVLKDTQITDLK